MPEIDGLRFIAIVSVVLFHLAGELRLRSGGLATLEPRYAELFRWVGNGDRGVLLFFVISGMILAMPFARHALAGGKQVSLRKFYMRRVTRLEPPYLLSMLLFTGMVAFYGHGHLQPGFGKHAAASALYLHSLIYRQMSPVNPVTWSLEVEIEFYLLAPLFMQLLRIPGKTLRRSALAAGVLVIGLAQAYWHGYKYDIYLTYSVQYFITGLLLADIFVLDLQTLKTSWLWDLAALASLAVMFGMPNDRWYAHTVLPLPIAVLCLSAMRSRVFRSVVATPWIAVIGGMCYSIYLLHFAFIAAFFKFTRHLLLPQFDFLTDYLIQVVVLGVPVLVCCVVFFVLVERPCMDPDWPGKLWHRITGRSMKDVDLLDTAGVAPDSNNG